MPFSQARMDSDAAVGFSQVSRPRCWRATDGLARWGVDRGSRLNIPRLGRSRHGRRLRYRSIASQTAWVTPCVSNRILLTDASHIDLHRQRGRRLRGTGSHNDGVPRGTLRNVGESRNLPHWLRACRSATAFRAHRVRVLSKTRILNSLRTRQTQPINSPNPVLQHNSIQR
jgi:hypothetical protein